MNGIEQKAQIVDALELVDIPTRLRAASLSAKGLLDGQIADILLLTQEQMAAIKTSTEFRAKYAEEAAQAIDAQFAREEGWDTLEDEALFALIQSMKFNRDPKFALAVAATANRAERRKRKDEAAVKVIDATNTQTNITILNFNRNYIDKAGEDKTIDVVPRPAQIPLKQSDVPPPKLVDQILAPAREKAGTVVDTQLTDLEKMFKAQGIVFDQG